VNVNVSAGLSRIVRLAGASGERFVLADRNVVVMNLDDYEDLLFASNERLQVEIDEDMREYARCGGVDYQPYRKRRLKK